MSVSGNYIGGVVRPVPVRLTTTNATDIVEAPNHSETLASFSMANETNSAVIVDCHYYNGSTSFLVYRKSVPATDTLIVSDIPLRLYAGDKFTATAETANAITVTPIMIRGNPNEVSQLANINSLSG